ncbi:MAG: hypothetical protein ABIH86_02240 [Planctomycetota bacterium]
MPHWTYNPEPFSTDDDLEQGDVIRPTEDVQKILRDVHPYFCRPNYLAFMVTTQSCDLVRRKKNSSPKAGYISLCSVRRIDEVIINLLKQTANPIANLDIFNEKDKDRVKDFLKKLFNQNLQAEGLFYLHNTDEMGIYDTTLPDSIAFLRVSIALKAEHYNAIMDARILRLNAEFRAKFGWLLGNLYSRPATTDWDEQEIEELIKNCIDQRNESSGPIWLDDRTFKNAKKNIKIENFQNRDELIQEIKKYKPKSEKEELIDMLAGKLSEILKEEKSENEESIVKKFKNRSMSSPLKI